MPDKKTMLDSLVEQGISRRTFLKFCGVTASLLALPPSAAKVMAAALATTPRPSIIWLHFQECTGCTESITRSFQPTLESLMLGSVSLDYHETLFAAAGNKAEEARQNAIGKKGYILVVEGSIPLKNGFYANAGSDGLGLLNNAVAGAKLVIAIGTCAAFGGIPKAQPNPSDAHSVGDLMNRRLIYQKPLINLSGCPPIPEVLTGVIVYYLTYGQLPSLDSQRRPESYYGETVHEECPRHDFYEHGQFANSFDDEGARRGWCLLRLGCKGPRTRNACISVKWNQGVSFPMRSGHGCLGCAEPDFWDKGGFYQALAGGGDDD